MEITNVNFFTEQEKRDFYKSIDDANNYKNDFSIKWCYNNSDLIKELHTNFYHDFQKSKYESYYTKEVEVIKNKYYANSVFEKLQSGETVKCECGSDLRIIPNYNFVGCNNYLAPGKHNKYSYWNDIVSVPVPFELFNYEIGVKYLSTLKKMYNLPKALKVSILADYIINVLNIKTYAPIKIKNYFIGGINSNISKKQEKILLLYLKDLFSLVNYQAIIKVYFDNGTTKLLIPDFICSNSSTVIIVEAKKSKHLEDTAKLELYKESIRFYMYNHSDNRTLKAITLFHDYGNYDKIKDFI